MKTCLVSFSSQGRENYNKGLLRLIDSALDNWDCDFLIYSPDHWLAEHRGVKIHKGLPEPEGMQSFPHSEMPYQFKVALIQQAKELGYKQIVWLDSSFVINKNLDPLFSDEGISVFHNLGHDLCKYISDDAVRMLSLSESELKEIPQIWGGALFFDFTQENARSIFAMMKFYSVNGSFKEGGSVREGFIAHRHDQAVFSILVHEHCKMWPYGKVVCPPHDTNCEYGNDIYLICRPNE